MNKTIPFGTHNIGYHFIIKLNMNLTFEDAEKIRKQFGFTVLPTSRKRAQLHRIEGVVSWRDDNTVFLLHKFFEFKKECKVNAQIEKLANKKANLLDSAIHAVNIHADLNDLPW